MKTAVVTGVSNRLGKDVSIELARKKSFRRRSKYHQ
jgi:short-subunit dehydrogenase